MSKTSADQDNYPTHTILLVEDEAIIATSEKVILLRHGYVVRIAASGKAAVEACEEEPFDLVLMDIDLGRGKMDGTEAARAILAEQAIPIVFLTSHSEAEMVERVEGISGYGYVLKNAGEFVLVQSVRMALKLFAAHRTSAEREQRYFALFNSFKHPITIYNRNATIVDINEAGLEYGGLPREQIIGRPLGEVIPDMHNETVDRISGCLEGGGTSDRIYRDEITVPDGSTRVYESTFTPLSVAEGTSTEDNCLVQVVSYDVTGEEETIAALAESRERYRLLAANVNDVIARYDLDFRLKYVSPSVQRLYGYTMDDFRKRSIFAIVHPDDRDDLLESVRKTIEGKIENQTISYRIFTGSGKIRWVQNNSRFLYDIQDRFQELVSVIRDITDERMAMEKLALSEERFRAQYEASPSPTYTWLVEGDSITLCQVNNAAVAETEGHAPDFISRTADDIYPDRPDIIKNLRDSFAQKKTIRQTTEYLTRGTRIRRLLELTYVFVPQNMVMLYTDDLTEQREAEARARNARANVELGQRIANIGYWQFDPEIGVPVWSDEVYRIYERDPEMGPPHVDEYKRIYSPDQFEVFRAAFSNAVTKGVPYDITLRLDLGDGRTKWIRAIGQPDAKPGEPGHFIRGTIQDITESQLREFRLKKLVEDKDLLLHEVNHRTKNNLAIVRSLLSLKQGELGDGVDLTDVVNQIDTIRSIHERLTGAEDPTHVDMEAYVRDILESVFGGFALGPVEIVVRMPVGPLPTRTAVALGLIINELATNAAKHGFTREGPRTFVSEITPVDAGKPDVARYDLVVSNSGVAIPDEVELENPVSLGLHLVTALAEQLKGEMEIRRRPNPEFRIRFAVKEPRPQPGTADESGPSGRG